MHRTLILLLLPALAACASGPPVSDSQEIDRWVKSPENPYSAQNLVEAGAAAIPALKAAILDRSLEATRRGHLAWILGRIWVHTRDEAALETYVLALQSARDDDSLARALFAHAHRFRDPEGRVLGLLEVALQDLRVVSAEMVTAAAAMSEVEALETLMRIVAESVDEPASKIRDIALRYVGRAARRGRHEAVAFLSMCTQADTPDVAAKASAELKLLAGRDPAKGWRDWWLSHNSGERRAWLAESFRGEKPFDPGDRDHLGALVARIPADGDAEPELWYLEQALGRSFGYVSPRDVFDPDVDPLKLAESNQRAVSMMREWWSENSPYLYFNPVTSRFDISEEARRIGTPVDPRTGKPGR
ncbi:MAG TPA: hypothetical protein VJU16_03080 [Planctomycetota bacterium]|nr:hypothetical protein [Planctomycetota bacterium]